MDCPLEAPNCKRKLMASNKPFEKKQCPLNIKPKCSLSPPACPLLPQTETKCGYAKLFGGDVGVNQCPCKTCFFGEGCPISVTPLNPCPNISDTTDKNSRAKWPNNAPPCVLSKDGSAPTATDRRTVIEKVEKMPLDKMTNKVKNTQVAAKCPLITSPRPLPCSECILQDFSVDYEGGSKPKTCPYLVIPNVCGEDCFCPDVPSIETGALCPFAPKPCPCCATPRCPLSRKPDCILQPKPPCCLQKSKCGICIPAKCPSSSSCCCGLCVPCCKPLCGICCPGTMSCSPPCIPCTPCPLPCTPCPLLCAPCSLPCPSTSCPLVNPCIPTCCPSTSLCSCSQPSCPLNPCPPLPCLGQCCSSPTCVPCIIKNLECYLDPSCCPAKLICPPIPPPCSLKNEPLDSSIKPKETIERTFHLPTCPSYVPPCGIHLSLKDQCPFSPNPCPISCQCPFPVSMSLEDKSTDSQEQVLKEDKQKTKGDVSPTSSKNVTFDICVMEEDELEDNEDEGVKEGGTNDDSHCPYSSKCGAIPLPTCPAAEFLCPDTYIKPKKVEKKPCPLKKCMKKPECPLGKLKPEVDCKIPSCPLTKEPDCPIEELMNRCQMFPKCYCASSCLPSGCCSVPLPCPINISCECTTDGHSQPLSSDDSTHLSSYSSSSITSPHLSKQDLLDFISSESNLHLSFSNILAPSSLTLNGEKLALDGCCRKNELGDLSPVVSENTLSSSECPFEALAPKRICQFAPPKCPLTPKPKTCPLTRKPDPCGLSAGGEIVCPVQYPPCKKFPTGRCPMGDINTCECDYPVSPCLLPLQDSNVIAPPQYCFREDCCMGLPFPPLVHKTVDGKIDVGSFYKFMDTKPGKEETKHYVQINKTPLNGNISLFGLPKQRVHNNWTIVRHGEGYRRCKTIAKKLEEMGPISNIECQYDSDDCPLDEETKLILENRKKHERDIVELENLKINLGFADTKETNRNKVNKVKKRH